MKLNWRGALMMAASVLLAGCAQVSYYVQAAQGEITLLSAAKPIDEWLADPATTEKLKDRLKKVKQIRSFAAHELGLPDNGTFKTYTDLKRPYVLWNVVAAPALSVRPAQWCFPIAGCVNYRGYYSKEEAQYFATGLRAEGFDVQVAGVPAYSTLGWFNDPVLSTFIQYPEPELARLVFHELSHQVAYAPGDSQFNESFATTVETAGLELWLRAFGNDALRKVHADHEIRKTGFLNLLLESRKELEITYASDATDAEKLQRKQTIFLNLQTNYQLLKTSWGGYTGYDRWFGEPLSNAHLAAVSTYHDLVPAFQTLLLREKTLPRFYAAVKALTLLDKDERHRRLTSLALRPPAMVAQTDNETAMQAAAQ